MSSAPVSAASAVGVRLFPGPTFSAAPRARREHKRFPIVAPAEYIWNGIRVQATTRDISSGGVFLNTDIVLPVGKRLQVWIDWPALLDEHCRLRLVIFGKILRSDWEGAAVEITRYEFRVRAPHPFVSALNESSAGMR